MEECDAGCGHQLIAYNSCGNRQCQSVRPATAPSGSRRAAKTYYLCRIHVVFTWPSLLGPLALHSKRAVYNLLFSTTGETLKEVAADPKHLGAQVGFIAVLHTWGQTLVHHPHLHCIVPGGGLADHGCRWVAAQDGFFLPVRALSRLFRGKFIAGLRALSMEGACTSMEASQSGPTEPS